MRVSMHCEPRTSSGSASTPWLRLGDGGDYEANDELDDVSSILQEENIQPTMLVDGGFIAPGYTDNNYISCYWGDEDAILLRNLSPSEWQTLKDTIHV